METALSISSDGCNTNTGHTDGVNRILEECLGMALQWLVCDLHLNEILFRHLFCKIDGDIKGPITYGGEIGSRISGKDGLARANMNMAFVPISGKVPDTVDEELLHNSDLKHLYNLSILTKLGTKKASQKQINAFFCQPGTVTAARWVTTACNLLTLYLQEENPSSNLTLMVEIIQNLYVPSLFSIKKNWHCSNGSQHLFDIIQLSRELFEEKHPDLYEVVKKTIRKNGYYCHPENVLLGMVHDTDEKVKNKGIQIIQHLRAQDEQRPDGIENIRRFQVPKNINFDARTYYELVDFDDFTPDMICSPPILKNYSLDDIQNLNFKESYKKVPSNSQHIERFVALTSKAAEYTIGYQNRHQYILNKVAVTKKIPTSATKDVYVNLVNNTDRDNVKKKLCTEQSVEKELVSKIESDMQV